MKIAACVHRILDPEAPFRLTRDGALDSRGAVRLMDPVDAAALEVAVQLAETSGGEVTAFTSTEDASDAETVLRTALAQGATAVIHVTGSEPTSSLEAGAQLAGAIDAAGPFDLVIAGWASSDHGGSGTAAVIAQRLGMPVVQAVTGVPDLGEGAATAERRRDAGFREVVRIRLPGVMSIFRGAAEPRFPTTPARLRSRRADIGQISVSPEAIATARTGSERFRSPPPSLSGMLVPLPGMDARERLRFLVAGGQARGSQSRVVRGSDEGTAALAQFIRERELIRTDQ